MHWSHSRFLEVQGVKTFQVFNCDFRDFQESFPENLEFVFLYLVWHFQKVKLSLKLKFCAFFKHSVLWIDRNMLEGKFVAA